MKLRALSSGGGGIGAGAVLAAGLITLGRTIPTIIGSFRDSVKDFHVHVIYASNRLIESNPDALKAFLAGWLETIRFMRDNKEKSIAPTRSHIMQLVDVYRARVVDVAPDSVGVDTPEDLKAVEERVCGQKRR